MRVGRRKRRPCAIPQMTSCASCLGLDGVLRGGLPQKSPLKPTSTSTQDKRVKSKGNKLGSTETHAIALLLGGGALRGTLAAVEMLVNNAMELNRLGRPFCRKQKPTLFLRLAMKMSHIQPEKEKVVDSSKTTISRGYQPRYPLFL
ncbi:hypothetical protein HPP92_021101 [Vanilla planifolia]|uniref:Uncharacterized protein n=1 Tax=Vanilla planifolia TaxID=51239 RepID=A0A835UJ41_VANPL|nr:hypothetical protein HPP92_021101 [Vanilla planifolia]